MILPVDESRNLRPTRWGSRRIARSFDQCRMTSPDPPKGLRAWALPFAISCSASRSGSQRGRRAKSHAVGNAP